MEDLLKRIVFKFTSGRFLLTVMVGVAFTYCVRTEILDAATTASIITLVFMSYFNQEKKKGEDNVDISSTV